MLLQQVAVVLAHAELNVHVLCVLLHVLAQRARLVVAAHREIAAQLDDRAVGLDACLHFLV